MTRTAHDDLLPVTERGPAAVPADTHSLFASVVCVVGRNSMDHAARQQATTLGDAGEVEYIETPRLPSNTTLLDRCDGADVLVLGADEDAAALIERASLPLLLARSCPSGAEVTDRILVAVDDKSEPHRAAEVAGRLASRHDGTVAVVPFLESRGALERATAATSRIVLQAAGQVPRVYGAPMELKRAVLSAVAAMDATLLVLPLGREASARSNAALIARLVGCSVLVIPVPPVIPPEPRAPSGRIGRRFAQASP
jgi:nucleotide-binding universal stress UspA family protein